MSIIESIRDLSIDHGTITLLERDDAAEIVREWQTYADIPPRTRCRLLLQPAAGSNINVELWLPEPEAWNGRYLGLGNGGAAGSINSDRFIEYVRKGYAVACTDMGTAPDADSGIGQREVWKDFGHRATHLMTTSSKTLIEAAYGRQPDISYFIGGSTGGQQALQEAQRHPDDYDAIVALVPAHCRAPLHAYFLWNNQIMAACPFSEEQEQGVMAAAAAFVAAREPAVLAGSVVSDPRCSDEDIEGVIALARERDPSLGDEHAEAMRRMFAGPRHAGTGERIFGGVPLGASFSSATRHCYLFEWVFGKDVDLLGLDFADDIERYSDELGPDLNAEDADLGPFRRRGGKLIIASGTNDAIVPYHATLDYYERIVEQVGSLEETQEFCRFFLVPGKAHGIDGTGLNRFPDMLEPLRAWREEGQAPGALRCRRAVDGETMYELDVPPYPAQIAADGSVITGPRGGVERVAGRFRPAPRS